MTGAHVEGTCKEDIEEKQGEENRIESRGLYRTCRLEHTHHDPPPHPLWRAAVPSALASRIESFLS